MGEKVFWLKPLYQLGFLRFFNFYFWIGVLDLLTGLDYLLLKILYDNRLHAGMGAKISSPLVDKILIDFENQDMIESSVLRIQELNINKYFN
jgi:hypothetical protein